MRTALPRVVLGRPAVVHLVDAQHLRVAAVASELVPLAHDERFDGPRGTHLRAQTAKAAPREIEVEVVEDLDLLSGLPVATKRDQIVGAHLRALAADGAG